jgi:hypothetical protein
MGRPRGKQPIQAASGWCRTTGFTRSRRAAANDAADVPEPHAAAPNDGPAARPPARNPVPTPAPSRASRLTAGLRSRRSAVTLPPGLFSLPSHRAPRCDRGSG